MCTISFFPPFNENKHQEEDEARIVGKPSRIVTHSVYSMKEEKKILLLYVPVVLSSFCFVVIFRYTWITLKYFVRRDEKRKKGDQEDPEKMKIEWLSGSEWVLCFHPVLCSPRDVIFIFPFFSFAWHRACRFGSASLLVYGVRSRINL